MHNVEPTLQVARSQLAAARQDAYAQTRYMREGAVPDLLPQVPHRHLTLREVYAGME